MAAERPSLLSEPVGQVGRALDVEQGICQGLQLLQRQGLDAGGGGVAGGFTAGLAQAKDLLVSPALREVFN
jgi:hypothetical protein